MEKPKPLSGLELATSAMGLAKGLALFFVFGLIEWIRAKEAQAKKLQAVAESNLKTNEKQNAVDQANSGKSSSDIVDEFLKGD